MSTFRTLSLAIAVLATLTAGMAQHDRAQIAAKLETTHAAVTSLHTAYSRPGVGGNGHYVHCELSFLGKELIVLDTGHGWPNTHWKRFYGRTRSYLRGRVFEVEWPSKLACETETFRKPAEIERLVIQSWFRGSGYWPDNSNTLEPTFYGISTSLLTAVRNEKYECLSDTERVHGADCVVLSWKDKDRIWLDTEHGYALRKRQSFVKGALAMEITVPELETVGPLALPKSFEIRVLRRPDGESLNPEVKIPVTVHENRVNDLRPEDHAYSPPPGSFQLHRTQPHKARQILGGGLGYLLAEADFQRQRFVARYPETGLGWGLVTALSILVLIGAWWIPLALTRARRPAVETSEGSLTHVA